MWLGELLQNSFESLLKIQYFYASMTCNYSPPLAFYITYLLFYPSSFQINSVSVSRVLVTVQKSFSNSLSDNVSATVIFKIEAYLIIVQKMALSIFYAGDLC